MECCDERPWALQEWEVEVFVRGVGNAVFAGSEEMNLNGLIDMLTKWYVEFVLFSCKEDSVTDRKLEVSVSRVEDCCNLHGAS